MTGRPLVRIGPARRFTRNVLRSVDLFGRPLLLKHMRDRIEAREEIRGHARLARHYRVPDLHARLPVPGGQILVYERLPNGPDQGLLLDLLNANEPSPALRTYLDCLTEAYREGILATARQTDPACVVRKLYWKRAAPGGRLDTYYVGNDFLVADGLIDLPVSCLASYTLNINGRRHHLDWAAVLRWVRAHFAVREPIWAALTQGDPTDVNLADPLAWFDYDTAGMNSVLGEFANFLWYTSALGGWLVPKYNPAAFADHRATFTHVPGNSPEVRRTEVDSATRTVHIGYEAHISGPRRAAVSAYWNRLVRPVADCLWPGADLADLLRPYLVLRLIGVYNLAELAPADRLVLLARLAETMSPTFDPTTYFCPLESPCPAP